MTVPAGGTDDSTNSYTADHTQPYYPNNGVYIPTDTPQGRNYLFFVAKNDGTHQFSRTVAEHNAAVVKYQRGGKALAP